MNRFIKKLLPFTLLTMLILTVAVTLITLPNLTAYASEDNSGAVYKISDDNTHIVIIGYAEEFPQITIPSEIEGLPVTEIAKNAFTNNVDLYSIVIPDTVTVIGEDAFRGCRSLVSVTLPSGLKALPMNCFFDCTVLKNITLPETLESIGDFCFEGCTKLGEVKIPASVTEIGYDAFVHCENILLDVSENEYAAAYALEYNVNTDYRGTSKYFWTVIGISIVIVLIVFFIISMLYLRYLKKNPEKNPNIFIFNILGKVYNALARLFNGIAYIVIKGLSYALYGITTAINWLKFKFGKNKNQPKSDDPDIDRRTE